jgi:hypothetical protein
MKKPQNIAIRTVPDQQMTGGYIKARAKQDKDPVKAPKIASNASD